MQSSPFLALLAVIVICEVTESTYCQAKIEELPLFGIKLRVREMNVTSSGMSTFYATVPPENVYTFQSRTTDSSYLFASGFVRLADLVVAKAVMPQRTRYINAAELKY